MYKNYLENKKRVKLITNKVKEMSVQEEYKPFIADILLRRAYEFELSDEDIEQDLEVLKHSLRNIIVEELQKSDKNVGGIYYSNHGRIVINEKLLGNSVNDFSTLTHEIYHALCYTTEKESNDSLDWVNDITQEWNTALLEIIIESAASRTVFEKGLSEENPYYNNYTNGYSKTTFAVNMICAAYGIKEKDFLKNAIMGEDRLLEFLSKTGNESKEDAKLFLNKIDANLSLLHSVFYRDEDEPKLSKKEIDSRLRDGLDGIYHVCMERLEERVNSTENKDNLKFSFNKMHFIIEEVLSQTSKLGLSKESVDGISKNIMERKKELFSKICDIVSEKFDTKNPMFPLTKEMKKQVELPENGEEEKMWNNESVAKKLSKVFNESKLVVYKNGEALLDKVKDLKGYYKHSDYRNLSEFVISRMDIPKEYKSIFLDVILRRAYQFKQEPEELKKDLEKLYARLSQIEVTTQNSHYNPKQKSLKMCIFGFLDDSKALYENFTYQTYKFLADENFEKNAKEDGLFRSMLQRASTRAVYDKTKPKNPYFNNEKVRDEYLIGVDLVAMTYGVTETELLKAAIGGKKSLIDFLSDAILEPKEETQKFLENLNEKLEKLKELENVAVKEYFIGRKESDEEYIEYMSDAIKLCIEKSTGVFDRIGEFEEKGITKENLSSFCKQERFYFNGLLKLIQGRSNGRGFIAKGIWENVQEGMTIYRDRLVETEEVVNNTKEGENVYDKIRELKERREEKEPEEVTFLKVDPEVMEECSERDSYRKSWGESRVFADTKMMLLITAMKKGLKMFKGLFGDEKLMLNSPNDETFISSEGEDSEGKKINSAKTFDEEIKVELSNEQSNDKVTRNNEDAIDKCER